MMYHITNLCPRTDISMGRCGFSIQLFPDWKKAVEKSNLNQKAINDLIEHFGRAWLDGCGYGQMYDPDQSPLDTWKQKETGQMRKLGPNARKLYQPNQIRVQWGEWGPEHITVPGDACGLDISIDGFGCAKDGASLHPHNIDNMHQIVLILVVFTTIADYLVNL